MKLFIACGFDALRESYYSLYNLNINDFNLLRKNFLFFNDVICL